MKKIFLVLAMTIALVVPVMSADTTQTITVFGTGTQAVTLTASTLCGLQILSLPAEDTGVTITAYNNSGTAYVGNASRILYMDANTTKYIATNGKCGEIIPMSFPAYYESNAPNWLKKSFITTNCDNGIVLKVEAGTNSATVKFYITNN